MRLGLLGPAHGDVGALGRAAELLLNTARVHRAVYLGNDEALGRVIAAWSKKLGRAPGSADTTWTSAVEVALNGAPERIDRFVASERARQRLTALESLPAGGAGHTTVRLGSRVVILAHDRTRLAENDLVAADILLFGLGEAPAIAHAGQRWLVTPGPIGPAGGIAVLEARGEEVTVTFFDPRGSAGEPHVLFSPSRMARASQSTTRERASSPTDEP